MNNKNTLTNWFYIGLSFVLLFILTMFVIYVPKFSDYDMTLLHAIQALLVNFPAIWAQQISNLGSHCFLWPQITAVSILFSHKKYWHGILLVIFTQIAWHTPDILKDFVGRERPCFNMCNGFSFPSGHAVTNVCFYGICIYLVLHFVKNKFWRYFLTTVFSAFIVLVLLSRMKLNVHYPADLLAGCCYGFILVNLFIICSKKLEK